MKAMFLTAIRRIEIREVPDPAIEHEDDVLVRVGAVGLCGSDVHYFQHGRIGCQVVKFPFTVGHEGAGTVEEVGRKVKNVRPGDRIAIEPAISCGACDQCITGRENTCRKIRFISCPGEASGCLCEKIVIPARNCHKVPGKMSLELAAFAEPLSIGIYSAKRAGRMENAKIAILGAGPIGLSVLLAVKRKNPSAIFVTDMIPERLEMAASLDAGRTINSGRVDSTAEILETEPAQLDIVFECCGKQEALDQSFELLKPGGLLVIVGIPELDRISFNPDMFRRKELTALYIRRQNGCVPAAIRMIARESAKILPLITHNFPLEKSEEAFNMVAKYGDGVIKAVIKP